MITATMLLSSLFFLLIIACLIMATLRGKDAWPFSSYPMFTRRMALQQVEVFRLALETDQGAVVWWQSRFYRYPEFIGRQLKRNYQRHSQAEPPGAVAALERKRYLKEVLRLIVLEEGTLDRYRALQIVQRRVTQEPGPGLLIQEQIIARILLSEIASASGQWERGSHVV